MAKSGYELYLGNYLMPVTPDKFQTKINNTNKTITLINDGEVSILKTPGLTEMEFKVQIPQVKHPYAIYKSGFRGADYFLDYFEQLKTTKKPFPLILCRKLPSGIGLFNTDIMVSMEDYKIVEEAKNGFDLVVDIKVKQWRDYGTKTVSITTSDDGTGTMVASVEPSRETTNSPKPTKVNIHTVSEHESLSGIAKYYYGDSSKYIVIYEANKQLIGGNPNMITAGMALAIPII